jgi:hypothetical protein
MSLAQVQTPASKVLPTALPRSIGGIISPHQPPTAYLAMRSLLLARNERNQGTRTLSPDAHWNLSAQCATPEGRLTGHVRFALLIRICRHPSVRLPDSYRPDWKQSAQPVASMRQVNESQLQPPPGFQFALSISFATARTSVTTRSMSELVVRWFTTQARKQNRECTVALER